MEKRYTIEDTFSRGLDKGYLNLSDVDLIREYILMKQARYGISWSTGERIASSLATFRKFLPVGYRDVKMADVDAGIAGLKTGIGEHGRPFTVNTRSILISTVKAFLLWMVRSKKSSIPIDDLEEIQVPKHDKQVNRSTDLYSPNDIIKLRDSCRNPRDRALIMCLYESGCRVSELLSLKWSDVTFDKYGARVYFTDAKKKHTRYSRLTISSEYLAKWKNDTPLSDNTDWVFIDMHRKEQLGYDAARDRFNTLVSRAGLKKGHMHLLRKSRITHMIQQNYQESVIKKTMWGNLDSRMFSTYVLLADTDIDAEMLDKAGIERKADVINPLLPVICPICHKPDNSPGSNWCNKCGCALTEEARQDVGGVREYVVAHPETSHDFFGEKLKK